MKKIYLLLGLFSNIAFAQLATPSAQIIPTTNPTTGNVGIGINNPTEKLSVEGNISVKSNLINTDARPAISAGTIPGEIRGISKHGANMDDGFLRLSAGGGSINWAKAYIDLSGYHATDSERYINITMGTHGAERLRINSLGDVGIGTTNPKAKLDVNGDLRIGNDDNYFTYNGYADILLKFKERGSGGRAIVHDHGNVLTLNYDDNFNGGTRLGKSFLVKGNNATLQGKFEAKEIKVTETPTADFVFEEDYKLPTLQEVEKHIKEKKHLPEIASAKEMEKEGVNVGEFQIQLLQKIEELTLYIIEQNKVNQKQSEQLNQLTEEINQLKKN
ncbi:hypothetical protein SAMN05443634_10320 [Chishuiella changwenlii]|uniref:Chaperone of endosialidase n=1 Tax=Chishuiella changwenlii TaxID=1434701 RepID=A0A1M6UQV1_9FLAO|nr:hypothetical protein [Chishuiella changwenlii]GGF08270.1 hypothetical protein GCM10010984_26850 [Chishuiella changwenlii]SHK71550.1 hypothetical protein SAMN05443634_10320 [Chishuiella changwenlii]